MYTNSTSSLKCARNNRCVDKSKSSSNKRSSSIDSHEEIELKMNEIEDKSILSRITWFDASLALNELCNQNVTANKTSLKIKTKIQSNLYNFGLIIQKNAGLILFAGVIIFLATSIGIKFINYENNFENLWVEGKSLRHFKKIELNLNSIFLFLCAEAGRVEQELNYIKRTLGDSISNSNQILLQTPFNKNVNILSKKSLLMHLELLQLATQVTVDLFDTTWKLKDICYSLTPPDIEEYNILQMVEKMLPCLIVTPLDCFWEGSKLLGPEDEIRIPSLGFMKWTNLNPKQLVSSLQENENVMRQSQTRSLTQNFLNIFKSGGITTGYQEKYCLNPNDDECPASSPNKNRNASFDIGAVLTGGCYGFANKWLHWPEQLILGAVVKNRQGKIIQAGSLQSIIQLMSDQNLYEFYYQNFKVNSAIWTREKAKLVLEAWQKKLLEEVQKFNSNEEQPIKDNNFYQFTSISLIEIMKNFNYIHLNLIGLSIGLVTIYKIFNSLISANQLKVHLLTELASILLIVISIVSGFGLCALAGLTFNANSMQIIPYLSFGIAMYLLEQIKSTYEQNLKFQNLDKFDLISRCLQQIGYCFIISGFCILFSFLTSSLIPIPVLRMFVVQTTILIACSFLYIFILFPAILSFDIKRFIHNDCKQLLQNNQQNNNRSKQDQQKFLSTKEEQRSPTTTSLFDSYPLFCLKKQIKFLTLLIYIGFTIYCLLGCLKVKHGLDLTDIVPKNTDEYNFLSIQKQQYNVFNMFLIIKGNFDYPNNQMLLYDYYRTFNRISNIVTDDNGDLHDFWLISFREWLKSLQSAFERDYKANCLDEETWFANASSEAILAFKLLSQTGRNDNPIERRISFKKRRLVDENNIINPRAFYNYLTAWVSNDALTYSASHVVFEPEPKHWRHDSTYYDLTIPKSQPLIYTQTSFLLSGLDTTETILKTIDEIRNVCDKFTKKGLNNFPTGLPFIFWEQFVNLKLFLSVSILFTFSFVFLISFFTFFNIWSSILILLCLIASKIQLFGLMGHLMLNLNSIPVVVLTLSTGLTGSNLICFMIHYLTCLGNSKDRRTQLTISKIVPAQFHGLNLFLLSIIALYWSEFNYIQNYFFIILLLNYCIDTLQILIFYPTILSLIGPKSELKLNQTENQDYFQTEEAVILNRKKLLKNKKLNQCTSCHNLSSPTPSLTSQKTKSKSNEVSYFRKIFPRMNTAISLSTISEESSINQGLFFLKLIFKFKLI